MKKNDFQILFIMIIILCFNCSRTTVVSHKPIVYAYEDGFELIVCKKVEGKQECFNSVKLKEADSLMKINQITRYHIKKDEVKKIKRDLKQYGQSGKSSSYPFIDIDIKEEQNGAQNIDLSYHYSKSTYHYCYEVIGLNYKPKWSSFKNFGRNEKTYYEDVK